MLECGGCRSLAAPRHFRSVRGDELNFQSPRPTFASTTNLQHFLRSWPIWEPMVAHVRELISEAVQGRIGQPTSRLAGMLAMFIAAKSLWPEAEALAQLA